MLPPTASPPADGQGAGGAPSEAPSIESTSLRLSTAALLARCKALKKTYDDAEKARAADTAAFAKHDFSPSTIEETYSHLTRVLTAGKYLAHLNMQRYLVPTSDVTSMPVRGGPLARSPGMMDLRRPLRGRDQWCPDGTPERFMKKRCNQHDARIINIGGRRDWDALRKLTSAEAMLAELSRKPADDDDDATTDQNDTRRGSRQPFYAPAIRDLENKENIAPGPERATNNSTAGQADQQSQVVGSVNGVPVTLDDSNDWLDMVAEMKQFDIFEDEDGDVGGDEDRDVAEDGTGHAVESGREVWFDVRDGVEHDDGDADEDRPNIAKSLKNLNRGIRRMMKHLRFAGDEGEGRGDE